MRARAKAGIVVPSPINEVVLAFRTWSRVIGNLVGRHAVIGANCLGEVIKVAREIVVGHDELASFVQAKEWRARLDGQLIKREMLGGLGNCVLESVRPVLVRLPGTRIDQVQRISLESGAGDWYGIQRFVRRV